MEIINTIDGFVNSDVDLRVQPKNMLLDSMNGQFIDLKNGSWAWKKINGNQYVFQLDFGFSPHGYIELPEKVIIFSTNSISGGTGEIGILYPETNTYETIYYHTDFNFSLQHQITGFGIKEADDIYRIYFSDEFNLPRQLNIALLNRINQQAQLVSGKKYLVVQDVITYSSIQFTKGSIFTYQTGPTISFGSGFVVEYIPINMMSWNPDVLIPKLTLSKTINGALPQGTYFITIRLGTYDGYLTPFTFITNNISAYNLIGGASYTSATQYSYTYMDIASKVTTVGFRFNISNLDTNFDFYEIAIFEADNWDEEAPGAIYVRKEITGVSETLDVVDTVGPGGLNAADILINPIWIKTVGSLTTTKFMNIIAKINESTELNIGQSIDNVQLKSEIYELPINVVDQLDKTLGSAVRIGGYSIKPNIYNTDEILLPGQWYKVKTGNFNYDGNSLVAGDYFKATTSGGPSAGGSGSIIAVHRIKRYYDRQQGKIIYDDIVLEDFYDYKSRLVANKMAGYWDEKYRIGLLAFDKKGYPKYVRHLGDITFPKRNGQHNDTNTYLGRTPVSSTPIIQYQRGGSLTYPYEKSWNAAIMSLIVNNLDLTDIIDDISAFAIVRSPSEEQNYCEAAAFKASSGGGFSSDISSQFVNLYKLVSPDLDCKWRSVSNQHYLELERKITPGSITEYNGTNSHAYAFVESADHTNYDKIVGVNGAVQLQIPSDPDNPVEVKIPNTEISVKNTSIYDSPGEYTNVANTDENIFDFTDDLFIMKVGKKSVKNYYGSSSDALEQTRYMFTGHFQIVDQAFKDAIKTGSKYIVDSIQVYGGDCFISIYSFIHHYANPGNASSYQRGYTIALQSRINTALAQKKTYITNIADMWPDDLQQMVFNAGTITVQSNFSFLWPAYPARYPVVSKHERKIRFSEEKLDGESVDSFRRFLTDNEISANYQGGAITHIEARGDKLYVWQPKMISFIPISERTLKTDETGLPIQLGVGGKFERIDDIYRTFGCLHKHSIVSTEKGFFWIDFLRRTAIFMDYNMGLTEESKILGFQSKLRNLPPDLRNLDNPVYNGGIHSGYDPNLNIAYLSYIYGSEKETYAINLFQNKYAGRVGFHPGLYLNLYEKMFSVDFVSSSIFVHDETDKAKFYNNYQDAYIELIINGNPGQEKIFHNGIISGNEKSFDSIDFWFNYNTATKSFSNHITEQIATNKYYKMKNENCQFAFPLFGRKHISGIFIKIRLTIDSLSRKDVNFIQFLTTFNSF